MIRPRPRPRPRPRSRVSFLPVLAAAALLPLGAGAQNVARMTSVDPAFLQGMEYRLVGPSRGGRVNTVTGVASQPRTFYIGVASGGVWRTTDGGQSWEPIGAQQIKAGSIGSIDVADSDPDIIWVGTGSDGLRSNLSTGRGVYRSTDGGDNWEFVGLYSVGQIGALRIHPTNPNVVWVAANGDAFRPTPDRGIYKSTDGGKSWKKTLFVSDSSGAMDVELQPGNPNVVYAWMSRIERKPWTIISGSREGGFYKSTDGGETWRNIRTGLPTELIGKGNLAVTAANPNRIYLLVEAKPGGGLYRSDDAGQTWQLVNSNPSMITRPFYYTTLGADDTNADVVYGGAESFFRSEDGGRTLERMRTPHTDNHDIWINPNDGNIMVQANDGGANVSLDRGRTWSTQMNQPTAEIYGVWVDDQFPYRLYGAQQDNSTIIIRSDAGPFNEADFRSGPGCETGPIIPHPTNPDTVYGNCKGQFSREALRTGVEKNYWIGGQSLYGSAPKDLMYRIQRSSAMEVSPHAPYAVYYGTQYVHRTYDEGVTWERLSPDLTAFPPCCQYPSGEPITLDVTGEEIYSTIYAIRESPIRKGVIWVGSNDGPFHVSVDDGKTWTNITPKDLLPGGRVQYIEPSPHRPGSAYYAVYRYLLGDYRPYIYRTDDYGKSWMLLTDGTNGIPADWPTRVVREDPDREGLLYAGTEFGMFISFDNGAHWQPFQQNLGVVPITDIKIHNKDMVVSTQGRAFWIMDNISALHQITPRMQVTEAQLFEPRDGYRTRVSPHLYGPQIDYYLPSAPDGAVTIAILDAQGREVNTYSSDAPRRGAGGMRRGGGGGGEPDPDEVMMEGRRRWLGDANQAVMNRVTKDVGMNRFVWDVRHSNGVSVPPGQYQVKLTVGGRTLSQPFNVLIDPNLATDGLTVADLRQHFEHNSMMRAMVAEVEGLVERVEAAQNRLRNATGAAADTAKRVEEIALRLNGQDVRYGLPGLEAQISYLAGMTSRADQKVGRDAIERHAQLRKELDAMAQDVARVLGRERAGGRD